MKSQQIDLGNVVASQSISEGMVAGDVPAPLKDLTRVLRAISHEYKSAIAFSQLLFDGKHIDVILIYTNSDDFITHAASYFRSLSSFIMICPYLLDTPSVESHIIDLQAWCNIVFSGRNSVSDAGRTLVTIIGGKDVQSHFTRLSRTTIENIHRQFQLIPKGGFYSSNNVNQGKNERDTREADEALGRWLTEIGVSAEARIELIAKFRIEIARAMRPKWVERFERGGPLATISAPLFLRRVHAQDIGPDGTVFKETIRAIDPELMDAVESYISKRKKSKDLGDAEGLVFVLSRPSSTPKVPPLLRTATGP